MAGADDPVVVGGERGAAAQRVDERELVGDRGEAVVLDEGEREGAGGVGVAIEEDALVGHEHVVEDGDRLHHLADG